MLSFFWVRSHSAGALFAFPDGVIHDVVAHRSAEETVIREGIDTVSFQQYILDRCLFAVRAKPVTVHQFVLAQVQCLHPVMSSEIRCPALDSHVIDGLALRHILVVQLAEIPYAVRGENVYLSRFVADDELSACLVIMDAGDAGAVQSGLAVVEPDMLRLFVHAVQTAVGDGKHLVGCHRYLRHLVVGKMRRPSCRM